VEGREEERRGKERGKGHEPPQYLEDVYAYGISFLSHFVNPLTSLLTFTAFHSWQFM